MLNLLRQRNFGLLWWGGLVSFIGDWALFVTLPLYVYNLSGSVLAMGALFVVSRLPSILLGSVAGVFVDRWDRRLTLVVTNLLFVPVLLPLLWLDSANQVWIVYLVSIISNTIRQFSNPAEDALLPKLVGEADLVTANALNSMNNNLARLIGPALGGVIFAAFGFWSAVLLDLVSFIFAAAMIALIAAPASVTRAQHEHHNEGEEAPKRNVLREWIEGLQVVRSNRIVYGLFVVFGINTVAEGVLAVLVVIWVKSFLHGDAMELGWILTAQAVGGILGSLFVGRVSKRVKPWQFVAWGFVLLGIIDLMIFNIPSLAVALILMAIIGLPVAGLFAGVMTMLQTSVEDRFRGRVLGAFGTVSAVLMLLASGFASLVGTPENVVLILSVVAVVDSLAGVAAFWLLHPARTEEPVHHAMELAPNPAVE